MKNINIARLFAVFLAVSLLAAGCAKQDSRSAAADLEKAFPPAPTPAAPGTAATPTAPLKELNQQIHQAISAIRAKSYDEAFYTLRAVQASPNITVDQYSAIESARLAVEREVAVKAAAGDPAAVKALQAIQKSH